MFIFEYISDSNMKIYVSPEDFKKIAKEKSLFVSNHHYEIDWVVCLLYAYKSGILGYALSIFKKSLAYMPVIGWAWFLADYITVERNFEKDAVNLPKNLAKVLKTTDILSVRLIGDRGQCLVKPNMWQNSNFHLYFPNSNHLRFSLNNLRFQKNNSKIWIVK